MLGVASRKSFVRACCIVALGVIMAGCSSKEVAVGLSPEERFNRAKAQFDDGDYLEAINEFTVITLQYQGSAVAADAQFYLAECRLKRGEYLLASYEYQTLRRNMPASTRVPEAQYKLGLCYYLLSPKSKLDQQYTRRAIDELQAFVEYYPNNEFVPDAAAKITELTGRLAKKEFESAELYATLDYYKSALMYYDLVIEKYHDTEYAPLSYLRKVELMIAKGKFADANTEVQKFLDKYPNSVLRARADQLKAQIDQELKKLSVSEKDFGKTPMSPSEANVVRTH